MTHRSTYRGWITLVTQAEESGRWVWSAYHPKNKATFIEGKSSHDAKGYAEASCRVSIDVCINQHVEELLASVP